MIYSKSLINKIGKKIRKQLRENTEIDFELLESLQEYRVSHIEALNEIFDFLVERSKYQNRGSLVVYRLKRIDTIISKIKREPTMAMSRMQDIAGCRAIVDSIPKIYNIVDDFKSNPKLKVINEYDYIGNPRDTGYSSYHIVVQLFEDERNVEVQLRTREQHYWATLVEITDVLYGIKLKEGQDHPDMYNFHKLLSKNHKELTLTEKKEIVDIDIRNELVEKLVKVFKSNFYTSIDSWTDKVSKENSKYLIMELDSKLSPVFFFFENFINAERFYFKKFGQDEPNMVLVHINNVDFEKIGLAYSNYVLTSHPSIRVYLTILTELILELKLNNKYSEVQTYYKHYIEIINLLIKEFMSEIQSIKEKNEGLKKLGKNNTEKLEIINDWSNNMLERFNFIYQEHITFQEKVEDYVRPKTKLTFIQMIKNLLIDDYQSKG